MTDESLYQVHVLQNAEGRFYIEDLQSFTGIRVNGERVQGKCSVTAGDLIQKRRRL